MFSFNRFINHSKNQLIGFCSRLQRALTNGGSTSGSTSAVENSILGHPRVRNTAFLLAGLVPVVKAWTPWKKADDDGADKLPNGQRLKIKNRKDKTLKPDIIEADELYKTGNTANFDKAFKILEEHLEKKEPEVLWRLGRLTYEKSKIASQGEKKGLLEKALELLNESLQLDEKNFATHKWMAILLNELSTHNGIKEQILQSVIVKKHMMRAAELNPNDATSIYLLGHWCFSVADIPWYQKKVAATLFATPPECSFQEAYKHFLQAEYTEPGFYSMNLLMLAKSCIKIGEMEKAEKYLFQLQDFPAKTKDDILAKQEAKELRNSLFKGKNFDATKEIPLEDEKA